MANPPSLPLGLCTFTSEALHVYSRRNVAPVVRCSSHPPSRGTIQSCERESRSFASRSIISLKRPSCCKAIASGISTLSPPNISSSIVSSSCGSLVGHKKTLRQFHANGRRGVTTNECITWISLCTIDPDSDVMSSMHMNYCVFNKERGYS